MPHRIITNSIGEARLNFYTRVLPATTVALTAAFAALCLWAFIAGREDRAASFLVVAIFLTILTVVALDVSRMLRNLLKAAREGMQP